MKNSWLCSCINIFLYLLERVVCAFNLILWLNSAAIQAVGTRHCNLLWQILLILIYFCLKKCWIICLYSLTMQKYTLWEFKYSQGIDEYLLYRQMSLNWWTDLNGWLIQSLCFSFNFNFVKIFLGFHFLYDFLQYLEPLNSLLKFCCCCSCYYFYHMLQPAHSIMV